MPVDSINKSEHVNMIKQQNEASRLEREGFGSKPNKLSIAQIDKIISSYSEKDMDELYIHNRVYLDTVKQLADTMRENERLLAVLKELRDTTPIVAQRKYMDKVLESNKQSSNLPIHPASQAVLCLVCGGPHPAHYANCSLNQPHKPTD